MRQKTLQDHMDNLEKLAMMGAQECLDISQAERDVTESVEVVYNALTDKLSITSPSKLAVEEQCDRSYLAGLKRGYMLGENGREDDFQRETASIRSEIVENRKFDESPSKPTDEDSLKITIDALMTIVQMTKNDKSQFKLWQGAAEALSALGVDLS